MGLKRKARAPPTPFWVLNIGLSRKYVFGKDVLLSGSNQNIVSGCLSFSTPPTRQGHPAFGSFHPSPAPYSQPPLGTPTCTYLCKFTCLIRGGQTAERKTKNDAHSLAPSTYHHLCSKHVFVPKLKVSHFLQDDLLVLPRLEEVRTAENRGVAGGLVPSDVDGVWLVIRIDSPRAKKSGCHFRALSLEAQRFRRLEFRDTRWDPQLMLSVPQAESFGRSSARERERNGHLQRAVCSDGYFSKHLGFCTRQALAMLKKQGKK